MLDTTNYNYTPLINFCNPQIFTIFFPEEYRNKKEIRPVKKGKRCLYIALKKENRAYNIKYIIK